MPPQSARALLGSRVAPFAMLYAAEGAPIGFIWWTLPTLLRTAGVPIAEITALTALLVLPWALKFLWAPFVDVLRSRRWGFRAWILAAQVVMGASLVPLVWLDPAWHFGTWRVLLLVHAIAAATQDVGIDALAIRTVPEGARGHLNGAMQAGMLVGRSLFGGAALLVASRFGRGALLVALIAWIWVALVTVALVKEPQAIDRLGERAERAKHHLGRALRNPRTWWGLGFALLSAAAFEAAGQLAGPFLVDRGASTDAIGTFFGIFVVAATMIGGLIGGVAADRWGHVKSCGTFLVGFVTMILGLAAADASGAPVSLLFALLTGMYLFIGLFTAASYALFMDLTDPEIGGTQFSAFMSATNACESWSALAGGRIAGASGYPAAFVVMCIASLGSLPILARLRRINRPAA
jgi:MFS family permease